MARVPEKITEIYVNILKWEKFNPRKDVRQSSWFRCEHSLFDNAEMINFSHSDVIVWLYILCQASKKSQSEITLYVAHAERIAKLSLEELLGGLHKLNDIKAIEFRYVTQTLRKRVADVRPRIEAVPQTCTTDERTRRDGRDETNERGGKSESLNPKSTTGIRLEYSVEFEKVWNVYQRKGDKKASYVEFQKLNLTPEDILNLAIAIENHHKEKTEPKYRKDFERFLKTDWREWLAPRMHMNGVHPKTQERLNSYETWANSVREREGEV